MFWIFIHQAGQATRSSLVSAFSNYNSPQSCNSSTKSTLCSTVRSLLCSCVECTGTESIRNPSRTAGQISTRGWNARGRSGRGRSAEITSSFTVCSSETGQSSTNSGLGGTIWCSIDTAAKSTETAHARTVGSDYFTPDRTATHILCDGGADDSRIYKFEKKWITYFESWHNCRPRFDNSSHNRLDIEQWLRPSLLGWKLFQSSNFNKSAWK